MQYCFVLEFQKQNQILGSMSTFFKNPGIKYLPLLRQLLVTSKDNKNCSLNRPVSEAFAHLHYISLNCHVVPTLACYLILAMKRHITLETSIHSDMLTPDSVPLALFFTFLPAAYRG